MATGKCSEEMNQHSLQSLFDLKGKVAVVTGGAGWLGTAISEALSELGAFVVIASRSPSKTEELVTRLNQAADEVRARHVQLDITQENSIKRCFAEVASAQHRLDVLVNNSYSGTIASLMDTTPERWQSNMDTGLAGPFMCLREAVPLMKAGGRGSVINIASMYGMVSPDQRIYANTGFQSSPAYAAAKAGLIQLTRYAACELAPDNVRVNAISPGAFPSTETQKHLKFIKSLSAKAPMGRIGKPYELKGAVAFLASDASSFVTGQNIAVDGGWTAW
jgi:NAD(P)-dependent dehydrogenase (short-subunit alcohol dehydrogenase family)